MPKILKKVRRKVAPPVKRLMFKLGVTDKPMMKNPDAMFRWFVENVNEAVFLDDEDGRPLYINPKYCELVGSTKKDIVGKHMDEFLTPETIKKVQHIHATDRKNGISSSYEGEMLSATGEVIPVLFSGTPLPGGGTAGFIADLRDVKNKERALKERINQLNVLYNVHAHIVMADPLKKVLKNVVEDVKKAGLASGHIYCRILLDDKSYVSNGFARKVGRRISAPIVVGGRNRGQIELGCVNKNHKEKCAVASERRLIDQIAGILSRHIASRDSIEANKKLVSLNELKDEFIAVMSHELRSPLTTARGYLSMLIEQASRDAVPYEMKHYINKAFQSTQTLNTLINNILDVSRVSSGRFILHESSVDILSVLISSIDQMELQAAENDLIIELDNETGQSEIILKVDEVRMGQVFRNVLGNAIKFSKSGTKIKVMVYKKMRMLCIEFIDRGIGVSRQDLSRVFDKFIQASKSDDSHKGGAGLGLFISCQIMEHHNGSIHMKSKLNEGTTVIIKLPLK